MNEPRESRRRRFVAAALALPLAACLNHVPPPATPARVAPPVQWPSRPPSDNYGRVALDVVQGPAVVELVQGRSTASIAVDGGTAAYGVSLLTRRLCTTPCTVDLPLGEHELRLHIKDSDYRDVVVVKAGETPSAVRVDLGWHKPVKEGRQTVGLTLLSLGLVFAAVSIPFLAAGDGDHDEQAGWLMAAGGAAGIGFGLYLTVTSAGEIRPSSFRQWDVEAPPVAADAPR